MTAEPEPRYPTELVDPEEDLDAPEEFDLSAGEIAALDRADRYLEAIARIRRERERASALHRAAVDRLQQRYVETLRRLQRDEDWYTAPVVGLHRALLRDDPDRKSIRLPNGDLRSRTPTRPRFEVADEAAFVAWAVESGRDGLVRTVTKPAMANVAEACALGPSAPAIHEASGTLDVDRHQAVDAATGEIVPGIVAYPPTTTFRIDIAP